MEDYLSERQQIEHLRGVVRENAPWAVSGVLIGVGLLVGWQQWQAWQQRQALGAGASYGETLAALSRGDREAAGRLATQLQQSWRRTPYADLATLALARFDAENGRYADAARNLEDLMQHARDADLKLVARLRLARVQRAAGQPAAALATLAAGHPPPTAAAAFAEVRADLLLDQGDRAGARTAYAEALASPTPGLVNRERLQLELAALGGAASAAPGAKP